MTDLRRLLALACLTLLLGALPRAHASHPSHDVRLVPGAGGQQSVSLTLPPGSGHPRVGYVSQQLTAQGHPTSPLEVSRMVARSPLRTGGCQDPGCRVVSFDYVPPEARTTTFAYAPGGLGVSNGAATRAPVALGPSSSSLTGSRLPSPGYSSPSYVSAPQYLQQPQRVPQGYARPGYGYAGGGQMSGLQAFLAILMGLLGLFVGLSQGGMGMAGSYYPPAPYQAYSQAPGYYSTPYTASPSYASYSPGGYASRSSPSYTASYTPSYTPASYSPSYTPSYGTGVLGQNQGSQSYGTGYGNSPVQNGSSFFRHLPLPEGSWTVGPNGHFWDCRARNGRSCGRPHHGNDLHASAGTAVYAVADGRVKIRKLNTDRRGNPTGYHRYIVLEHLGARTSRGSHYNTLYGHIEFTAGISVGSTVRAGQQIGTVSGRYVSSPHCHFEVLVADSSFKGTPVNPNAFARFHRPGATADVVHTASLPPYGKGMV